EAIDYVLQDEGKITAALVPGLFQFRAGEQPLDARFRTRHRIEAVRRLWATADAHALALAAMLREDYDAARMWSDYLATEIKLDKLILQEAAQYDIDEARVRSTPPLRSTVSLVEAMIKGVLVMGSAPSVAYSVMV